MARYKPESVTIRMAISVTRPSIRRKDMDSVLTCMVSDQLGPGVRLEEFSSELSRLLSGSYAVAVREYTRAIELAFNAVGLEPGDSIILSPLAPAVYADVLWERGIIPVFCDVEAASANLDLEAVENTLARLEARFGEHAAPDNDEPDPGFPESKLSRMPKAILLDSPLGVPYSLNRLEALEIPIIEDASHGLGAGENGETIGTLGKFTVLSLEPDSIFTAGGGAAVVARGRSERTSLKRAAESLRTTSLLPDMNASLGLAQLRALGTYIRRRREVADAFRRSVMQGRHKAPASGESAVPFAFPVMIDGGANDVIAYARKKDVEAVWAFSETIMAVADYWEACASERFTTASALLLRCLLFPLYPTLTNADIERISKVLTTLP